ncbi:hypothetical protein PC116_g15068 [Phytophthora cactorum]|uniref:Uncharacterized protein n=1 Tax=Phytophthora cactorum TaxID=29920 RepID=A0A8T1C283_9STRA|nr:hypothetical protein PC117_g18139 [Phytophthora cactorum]KAG4046847.1 hypothetical protein PC123_g17783 [Phytophthora cactorum]KAG4236862.1 hypothetical protein PC116_g15068 [Phytophthora cactorum]
MATATKKNQEQRGMVERQTTGKCFEEANAEEASGHN